MWSGSVPQNRPKGSDGAPPALQEAAQRSQVYRALAASFRYPVSGPGADFPLDLPPRCVQAGAAFLAAFDPAVSRDACSLHEAAYAQSDRAALFEELVRFYGFFGLSREETAELPDHVTVELEFMHFLTYLEARTVERGGRTGDLRRAQRDFLSRHLARLAKGIQQRCRTPDPHLAALSKLLTDFVEDHLTMLSASSAPFKEEPDAR